MKDRPLSARQAQILDVVRESIANTGYPPSVREIGKKVGLASPSTVKHHLDALEKLGLLQRSPGLPRALDLRLSDSQEESSPTPPTSKVVEIPAVVSEGDTSVAPLVGRIAAGSPITAEQSVEDYFSLPTRLTGRGELFVLEVHGDSMIDGAICDGDYVVVRAQAQANNGEIVAAMLDGEATVKVLSERDGHRWLLPMNENYAPIFGDEATILGKVVTLVRAL
ncbi:transcriptional repressor LexA [Actinomycetaceae bacterium WB03_NA08]|uniref:LexA repressor n=1 Tax=Scrofimicrobium canadense TaxID=2652290 RepID=A0A6N7W2H0_9ACTO|nr:transcriptional repressor LexA [Scrofimicrobium canadense]MSS83601.1 transcriptional repressor LexA [Scrofimicrobium canadense]